MIATDFLEELRARVSVSEVVGRRVRLRKAGREWKGLSPFNKERTPSFYVNDQKRFWHDFSSGKHGDVFDFIQETEAATFPEAVERIADLAGVAMPDGRTPAPAPAKPPISTASAAQEDKATEEPSRTQRLGLNVWDTAGDIGGTPAAQYLAGRKLELPEGVSGRVLRFHPRCPWRDDAEEIVYVQALIGLCRDIHTDEPQAIIRRALTAEGRKLGKPRSLGPTADSAIKLTANEDVEQGLHVGEGIETMLAAVMLGFAPAWALGGAGLRKFPVLNGIDALTIIADNDKNGAGQAAASECFERWIEAGREACCVLPGGVGVDMNDIVAR